MFNIGDEVEVFKGNYQGHRGEISHPYLAKCLQSGDVFHKVIIEVLVNQDEIREVKVEKSKSFTRDDLWELSKDKNNHIICTNYLGDEFILFQGELLSAGGKHYLSEYYPDLKHKQAGYKDITLITNNGEVVFNRVEGIPYKELVDFQDKIIVMIDDLDNSNDGIQALEGLVKIGQTIMDFINEHYEFEEEDIRPEVSE